MTDDPTREQGDMEDDRRLAELENLRAELANVSNVNEDLGKLNMDLRAENERLQNELEHYKHMYDSSEKVAMQTVATAHELRAENERLKADELDTAEFLRSASEKCDRIQVLADARMSELKQLERVNAELRLRLTNILALMGQACDDDGAINGMLVEGVHVPSMRLHKAFIEADEVAPLDGAGESYC